MQTLPVDKNASDTGVVVGVVCVVVMRRLYVRLYSRRAAQRSHMAASLSPAGPLEHSVL